jgi:hypothetical protein
MVASRQIVLWTVLGAALACGSQWLLHAQQAPAGKVKAQPKAAADRFEFNVVQSFDAKYEGDAPGHVGRYGGLENRRPQVALGDPVFRGDQQVGKVTGLGWSPVHGSLEVEFDPVADVRIAVGDQVWLRFGEQPAAAGSKP